jgi:transposase-like protein
MKPSRFSEEQRGSIVSEQSGGNPLEGICREHQISPATFYKWKRELKQLREEIIPKMASTGVRRTDTEAQGIELRFIPPGKPTQNGLIKRLNGTLRTDCLNLEWFDSLEPLN